MRVTRPSGRRYGPACGTCKLPVHVRGEIAQRARAGQSRRSIAEHVTNLGHPIGKDALARHLTDCVGLQEHDADSAPEVATVLMAQVVADCLSGWHHISSRIATRLHECGLTDEAEIVLGNLPESLRRPLVTTDENASPAGELLAGRLLAAAVARVLSRSHPTASLDLAADLDEHGALDLADSLRHLAASAATDSVFPMTPEDTFERRARVLALRAIERMPDPDRRSSAMALYQHQYGPVRLDELAQAKTEAEAFTP